MMSHAEIEQLLERLGKRVARGVLAGGWRAAALLIATHWLGTATLTGFR